MWPSNILSLTMTCSRPRIVFHTGSAARKKLWECCVHEIRGRHNAKGHLAMLAGEYRRDGRDGRVPDATTLFSIRFEHVQTCAKVAGRFGACFDKTSGVRIFSCPPDCESYFMQRSDILSLAVTCSRPQVRLSTKVIATEKMFDCCFYHTRRRYSADFRVLV